MNKKILVGLTIIALIVVGFGIYWGFARELEPELSLIEVRRGDVHQEISEIGAVKIEEVGLNFKNAGTVEEIYINVGQKVEEGELLARIDLSHLKIRLQGEENNAQVALVRANQGLIDTKEIAKISLETAYETAINTLRGSILTLNNTFNTIDLVQKTYFMANDQEGIRIRIAQDQAEERLSRAENYLNIAKIHPTEKNIDVTLLKMRETLEVTAEFLDIIRDIMDSPGYRYRVLPANKIIIDTEKGRIVAALTGIIGSQQAIYSTRVSNQAQINSAEGSIRATETLLTSIEEQLAVIKDDSRLFSPVNGKIVRIDKKIGEIFMPGIQPFISLVPDFPFQMEVAIHEEDLVLIAVGNPVKIEIFAFPDQFFKGRIVSIETTPDLTKMAATRMVFYQVTVDFQGEIPKDLELGMTGDLIIITDLRPDVLIISEDAIQQRDDKFMVEVYKAGIIEKREIQIGLRGEDDKVEIISGLIEGEQVVIR